MSKVIGIDLGTTNSCVSVVENQTPVIIPCSTGGQTTPSVVAFAKNGERMVGAQARRQAVTNPDRTISSVKRHMGTDWEIRIDGLSMNRRAHHRMDCTEFQIRTSNRSEERLCSHAACPGSSRTG